MEVTSILLASVLTLVSMPSLMMDVDGACFSDDWLNSVGVRGSSDLELVSSHDGGVSSGVPDGVVSSF